MKSETTLIHVGFQGEEAVRAKRDLLSLEMSLLEATKAMTNYHSLRSEELKLKVKLHLKTKEYILFLKLLKKLLPKVKLPKMLKELDEEQVDVERIKEEKVIKYGSDVDSQLEQIQDKLKSLQ